MMLFQVHALLNVALSRGVLCAESVMLKLEQGMGTPLLAQAHALARTLAHPPPCSPPRHVIERESRTAAALLTQALSQAA